jgi:hypothetical protein
VQPAAPVQGRPGGADIVGVAPTLAPIRSAYQPVAAAPDGAGEDDEDRPRFGTGHLNATLIATAALVLVVLVVAAWSIVPTLYVRPDGVRARPAPQPRQLGQDLKRAALRLTEPVTIRRR